jgi:hypothetical protein
MHRYVSNCSGFRAKIYAFAAQIAARVLAHEYFDETVDAFVPHYPKIGLDIFLRTMEILLKESRDNEALSREDPGLWGDVQTDMSQEACDIFFDARFKQDTPVVVIQSPEFASMVERLIPRRGVVRADGSSLPSAAGLATIWRTTIGRGAYLFGYKPTQEAIEKCCGHLLNPKNLKFMGPGHNFHSYDVITVRCLFFK